MKAFVSLIFTAHHLRQKRLVLGNNLGIFHMNTDHIAANVIATKLSVKSKRLGSNATEPTMYVSVVFISFLLIKIYLNQATINDLSIKVV